MRTSQASTEEARQILLGGAEYIATNGHCKGSAYGKAELTNMPSACATGGMVNLRYSLGYSHYASHETAVEALYNEVRSQGYEVGSVPEWNDLPQITAEDVILAMKKAAASLG